jgi:hypothetical protein
MNELAPRPRIITCATRVALAHTSLLVCPRVAPPPAASTKPRARELGNNHGPWPSIITRATRDTFAHTTMLDSPREAPQPAATTRPSAREQGNERTRPATLHHHMCHSSLIRSHVLAWLPPCGAPASSNEQAQCQGAREWMNSPRDPASSHVPLESHSLTRPCWSVPERRPRPQHLRGQVRGSKETNELAPRPCIITCATRVSPPHTSLPVCPRVVPLPAASSTPTARELGNNNLGPWPCIITCATRV